MTIDEAKQLKQGTWIYTSYGAQNRREPLRAKVTSVKTWKRTPGRIEVRVKYGLYGYWKLHPEHLSYWSTVQEEVAK